MYEIFRLNPVFLCFFVVESECEMSFQEKADTKTSDPLVHRIETASRITCNSISESGAAEFGFSDVDHAVTVALAKQLQRCSFDGIPFFAEFTRPNEQFSNDAILKLKTEGCTPMDALIRAIDICIQEYKNLDVEWNRKLSESRQTKKYETAPTMNDVIAAKPPSTSTASTSASMSVSLGATNHRRETTFDSS